MPDQDIRRIIEEATRESLNQSFTEAGRRFIEAAQMSEEQGDQQAADRYYEQAADAFFKAAEKYRSSKSFKNAAMNMCAAGDLFSELADSERAMKAYERAAEDLYLASDEHIMWGDENETKRGTVLAVVASMIYLMIGKENLAFSKARAFLSKNASKLVYPTTVRISQIPQMFESAIQRMDLEAFSSAETVTVTELKSSLVGANAQEFVKYVDRGLDMVREILRGRLKVPKITSRLELPIDATFKEPFTLRAVIQNEGDGDALGLNAEWFIDDELILYSGDRKKSVTRLPAGQSLTMDVTVRSTRPDTMGIREYQAVVRGSYADMLKTEYSLQVGPGTIVVRDFKITEKLLHDVDVSDGRVGLLRSAIATSSLERESLLRVIDGVERSLKAAREEIKNREIEVARARIGVANEVIDAIDNLIGDESLIQGIVFRREQEKKEYARSIITPVYEALRDTMARHQQSLQNEMGPALAKWDADASLKRQLADMARMMSAEISEIMREIEALHTQLPAPSHGDSPEVAANKTRLRTRIESIHTRLQNIQTQIGQISANPVLSPGTRPSMPERLETAVRVLREVNEELGRVLELKRRELT